MRIAEFWVPIHFWICYDPDEYMASAPRVSARVFHKDYCDRSLRNCRYA